MKCNASWNAPGVPNAAPASNDLTVTQVSEWTDRLENVEEVLDRVDTKVDMILARLG